jgi:hypothetical protein
MIPRRAGEIALQARGGEQYRNPSSPSPSTQFSGDSGALDQTAPARAAGEGSGDSDAAGQVSVLLTVLLRLPPRLSLQQSTVPAELIRDSAVFSIAMLFHRFSTCIDERLGAGGRQIMNVCPSSSALANLGHQELIAADQGQ